MSPGCARCYAETLVTGRMGRGGTWGDSGTRERTSPSLWRKPIRWAVLARDGLLPDGTENRDGHRPRIFCASLADVFEPRPELDPWRYELFVLIEKTPELDWLLLTKRPEEARDWLRRYYVEERPLEMRDDAGTLWEHEPSRGEWVSRDGLGWGCLPNLWLGTSIENSRFTWRADVLREVPAAIRFISAEPLLASLFQAPSAGRDDAPGAARRLAGPASDAEGRSRTDVVAPRGVDQGRPPGGVSSESDAARDDDRVQDGVVSSTGSSPVLSIHERAPLSLAGIDWVIVGGESGGQGSRPLQIEWAREIRDAILAAGYECCCQPQVECCGRYLPTGECCANPVQGSECCGEYEPRQRPALHFKQWGSHDATGIYRGPSPTSGGKLLDGIDWCEFPDLALTPA